jgi:SAM-dependent methyltransferase
MHGHMLNILEAELARRQPVDHSARILDVGCGDCRFLAYANRRLPERSGRALHLHGMDVTDAAIQREGYFQAGLERLYAADSSVDWSNRLHLVASDDPWPFESESFDAVVSNQVGEHVHDIDFFLSEACRVVRPGGFAVHIFPLKQYILEGHTGTPLAHRVLSHDLRTRYLATFARMGFSKVGPLRLMPGESPEQFGETRSDYISFQTKYRTWVEVSSAATEAGWRATYRYTSHLYLLKLGYLLGHDLRGVYRRPRPLVDALTFRPLSLVSSVTIFLEKEQSFIPDLHALE